MERRFFGRKNENAGMIDETGNPGYSPAFFSRIFRKHSRFEFVYRSMLRFRELAPLPCMSQSLIQGLRSLVHESMIRFHELAPLPL